jgi:hypothetical protein
LLEEEIDRPELGDLTASSLKPAARFVPEEAWLLDVVGVRARVR